jgi:hypothetical protein
MSFQCFGQKLQISGKKVWFSFLHLVELDRIRIRKLRTDLFREGKSLGLEIFVVFPLFKLILSMLGFMTIHLFLPRHQHPCGHAG